VTQAQDPTQCSQLAQSLSLLSLIHTNRVVSEGVTTTAAAIAIDLHCLYVRITHLSGLTSPALQDFPIARWALGRTIFDFSLDIGQFQHDNGHGKLRLMVV
jgi:hypothetical protein